eukprot:2494780-Amphidinium_carterae.1
MHCSPSWQWAAEFVVLSCLRHKEPNPKRGRAELGPHDPELKRYKAQRVRLVWGPHDPSSSQILKGDR